MTPVEFVREFQRRHGLTVDGDPGPNTIAALPPSRVIVRTLKAPAAFFSGVRDAFGVMDQDQVDGFNVLLTAMAEWPVTWAAYGLATAWHETAHTMQPIAEYGRGKGRKYGAPGRNRGQVAYGRGYVQLTWDDNYERADGELGLNGALIADYNLAMKPDIAARILVRGMAEGWFTGKANRDYLPGDYVGARRIINGSDRAEMIAGHARAFQAALINGGWS